MREELPDRRIAGRPGVEVVAEAVVERSRPASRCCSTPTAATVLVIEPIRY